MPPEYQTYLVSPHARVPCVDCHIGRGLIIEQAFRKAGHMRLLWATLTNSFEYPIHVSTMRPARDTCELCHFPEKFSDDSLRELVRYRENEENTPYSIYLLMHTGGGSTREGLGFGIHWHVENQIEFVATDELNQEIPWVRVTTTDGAVTEYVDQAADFNPDDLANYELQEMDCITCHNRISHLIEPPRQLVNDALDRGDLSAEMPNIRYEAENLLAVSYESSAEAADAIESLSGYYEANYPTYYQENQAVIDRAIVLLQDIWNENNFVEQELNWQTHPNNIGHRDWPGCFRCHDGEHVSESGEVVRLECNLCHSIPQVVEPSDIEPTLPLATGLEPASHLDSTWIRRHHNEFDRSCANCHTVENPGGTSDTSFCSNSACHGSGWDYAGFDAPTLALEMGLLQEEPEAELPVVDTGDLTYQELQPVLEAECGDCHGDNPTAGLRVTDYESLMAGGRDGAVIDPGNPEDSLLFEVVDQQHFGSLTTAQRELLALWVAAGAPEGEPPQAETTAALSFETLQPIFIENCGECHGPDDPTRELNLTEYDAFMVGGRSGPPVEPGDPESSLILEVLEEGHFAELSDDQLNMLRAWIAAGAPATGAAAAAPGGPTYQDIQPILAETCGECHGPEDPTRELNLTDYDSVITGGRSGPAVEPGDPEASLIIEVLEEGHRAELPPDHMQLLRDWIAAGAPEGGGEATGAAPGAADSGEGDAAGRLTYGTFQPVLVEQCGDCHGEDDPASNLNVTTYDSLLAGSRFGPVIVPGNPGESYILDLLQEEHPGQLTTEQYLMLRDWIAAGAPAE